MLDSLIRTCKRIYIAVGSMPLGSLFAALTYPLYERLYRLRLRLRLRSDDFSRSFPNVALDGGRTTKVVTTKAKTETKAVEPQPWSTPGALLSWQRDGRTLRVQAEHAALEVAVLAPDVLRVRLSPTGDLPEPFSYAVAGPGSPWPHAPWSLAEGPLALILRTDLVTLTIARADCKLAFLAADGRATLADAAPLSWCGPETRAAFALPPEERIFGLGNKSLPLDRRGAVAEMWNSDTPHYIGKDPLYLNVPFYLALHEGNAHGLLCDNPCRARFDFGATQPDRVTYTVAGGELRYTLFAGPEPARVLERYTALTGRMPLPPLWALGYQQSRWGYSREKNSRSLANEFRRRRIPCDVLYLDIDYMDGSRVFTWHPRRQPQPAETLAGLRQKGFKTVAIIDPGVKADPAYAACRSGLQEDVFCRRPDGSLYSGPVWPGYAYFADFTSPRARRWWTGQCAEMLRTGLAGLWCDMNEPSVFGGVRTRTMPDDIRHDMEGRGGDHAEAHNVYGMLMARATREAWAEARPDERPFVLTRAGHAGVQRYAAAWTGDNDSTWEQLRLSVPMVLGLGLSGIGFTGPDTGGFAGDCNGELLLRWVQQSAFFPFFRNHSSVGARPQEPWAFGEPWEGHMRAAIELRYRLLPYLYTAFWQCAETGAPILRPLFWANPADPFAVTTGQEFLCGDSLLVAPIGEPGARERWVYLPAGAAWYDLWTGEGHKGLDWVKVPAALDRIPVFARAGSVVPAWPLQQHVGERPVEELTLHLFPGTGASWLYEDDGETLAYERGERRVTRLTMRLEGRRVSLHKSAEGSYTPAYTSYRLCLHGVSGAPRAAHAGGQPVTGWQYDAATRTAEALAGEFEELTIEL